MSIDWSTVSNWVRFEKCDAALWKGTENERKRRRRTDVRNDLKWGIKWYWSNWRRDGSGIGIWSVPPDEGWCDVAENEKDQADNVIFMADAFTKCNARNWALGDDVILFYIDSKRLTNREGSTNGSCTHKYSTLPDFLASSRQRRLQIAHVLAWL